MTPAVRLALLAPMAASVLAGCEHAENYRWSSGRVPSFNTTLDEPPESEFREWDMPSVSVYSFATPAPPASETTLRDLSDHGQAALIAAMAQGGATAEEIRALLAKPLRPATASTEGGVTTEGTYRRTLVANVTKGWSARPGDRLVWTWIDVRPLNFVFDGYSVIATDNQLLNIEQVTNATAAGVNGSLGRSSSETATTNTAGSPISNVLATVAGATSGVGGSLSNTHTTVATINQQYVKLGADILPTELRIYRESERNLDVAGNTLIALTLRLDPTRWRGVAMESTHRVTKLDLADDNGTFRTPREAVLEVSRNEAPPPCALTANVTLFYQIRRVRNGRSYVEGEHNATYVQGRYDAGETTIVEADDVRRATWRVYPVSQPNQALQVKDVFGWNNPLDFTSYEQANNFAAWLHDNGATLLGVMDPAIGASGLTLSSGVDGQVVYPGRYQPRRLADPADLQARCDGMSGRARPVPIGATPPT